MSRAYSDIAFTPAVRAVQTARGSRAGYAALDHSDDRRDALGDAESAPGRRCLHARQPLGRRPDGHASLSDLGL